MKLRRILLSLSILMVVTIACSKQETFIDEIDDSVEVVNDISSISINRIKEDDKGYIWIASASHGLLKYDGTSYIHFQFSPTDPNSISADRVNDILIDKDGKVWIATQRGVDIFDGHLGFNHAVTSDLNNYFISLCESSQGLKYGLTRQSIQVYSEETGGFKTCLRHPYLSKHDPEILIDRKDNLWVKYDNQLLCYDATLQKCGEFVFDDENMQVGYDGSNTVLVCASYHIHSIDINRLAEEDLPKVISPLDAEYPYLLKNVSNDILLIRTMRNSYCLDCKSMTLYNGESEHNPYSAIISKRSNNYLYDHSGNVWLDNSPGLAFYKNDSNLNVGTVHLDNFLRDHNCCAQATNGNYTWYFFTDGYVVAYNNVSRIISWRSTLEQIVGTNIDLAHVVYTVDGYLLVSNGLRSNTKTFLLSVADNGGLSHVTTYFSQQGTVSLFDDQGQIWSPAPGAVLYAPRPDGKEKEISFESIPLSNVTTMSYACASEKLNNGNLLLFYTDMLPVLFNPKTRKVVEYNSDFALNQVYYSTTCIDNDGNVWIGTSENGLLVYSSQENTLKQVEGLNYYNINGIKTDATGEIFVLASNKYLYSTSSINEKPSLVWKDQSDIPTKKYLAVRPGGEIVLSTSKDIVRLNQRQRSDVPALDPPLSFIVASGKSAIAEFNASEMSDHKYQVKLDRNANNISVRFSMIGYSEERSTLNYQYSVNGSSKKMVGSYVNPVISLYNIKPGRNRVTLSVFNDNAKIKSPEYVIWLKSPRPLYYIALQLCLLALLLFSVMLFFSRRKRISEALNEKRQRTLQEEINVRNMDFFANISHEFRTPLTIINGAASVMESSNSSTVEKNNAVAVIKRNTARMLKLVGQILDFNKLDHDMLRLSVKREDISAIVKKVFDSFALGANMKNIDFILDGCESPYLGMIDSDKLEKILYNLLSNSFKFTPPGGSIMLTVSCDKDLIIKVSDSGIGIPEDQLNTIFDRFAQISPVQKVGGTGIGLYFTKGLTNLHHGEISAANRYETGPDGKEKIAGAVFTVVIPITEDVYTENELAVSEDTMVTVDKPDYNSEIVVSDTNVSLNEAKRTVLIIDDDYEMVHYLKTIFQNDYNVVYRFDAMSGYNMIETIHPDLIVCDLMMVDMDGLELCKMVKNNVSMCHIPLIMLTAKSTLQDQLDSFKSGADAFVTKPFNPESLLALATSQMENRRRMSKILTSAVAAPEPEKNSSLNLSHIDQEFMNTVYELMEKNLDDGQLDIDSIAEMIGVSRSKFYYKLKALTGQTPNEFFTSYKLNRAKEMLDEGKYKISAIANIVGFNSGSHFANLFKKKFGVLPSQYIEEQGKH